MSDVETHTGLLRKINIGNITINEWKREVLSKYVDVDKLTDENIDELWWNNDLYNKYFIKNHDVYEFLEHDEFTSGEYADIWYRYPNGDIRFLTQFYTGGCDLDEAINYAIDNDSILNIKYKIRVDYCETPVPEYLLDKFSSYSDIYLSGTKMFLGYKATYINDNKEYYYVRLNAEQEEYDIYNTEEEMLNALEKLFNDKNICWRFFK